MAKKYMIVLALTVAGLAVGVCCWSVSRNPSPEQETPTYRDLLAEMASWAWGEHMRIESVNGPANALALVLQSDYDSCTKPAIHHFILHMFGLIDRVATVTCKTPNTMVTVQVKQYKELIEAVFPMLPDHPETIIEFGGTVTQMPPYSGRYEKTRFQTRQELIDFLQIEPRGYQFGSSPKLHKSGIKVYAAPADDKILVVETVACDMPVYRGVHFSSTGGSQATTFKWTQLGGTFVLCKGEKHAAILGMQDALSTIGLYPVNSIAECADRRTLDHCN